MDAELPVVELHDERTVDRTPVDLPRLGTVMAQVLGREGVGPAAEAGLILVDEARIADLKAEYLDGDGSPTDVLSFPLDDGPPGSAAATPVLLGDVVICPSVAAAQAPDHAGSLTDELVLLTIHGALHLLGWDHADAHQESRMWAHERELMTELHGAPAGDPWRLTAPADGKVP